MNGHRADQDFLKTVHIVDVHSDHVATQPREPVPTIDSYFSSEFDSTRLNTTLTSPLTYKILTTSQPPYLRNLISLQTDNNTRSSDVVTLARPFTAFSLKVTDRSFQYVSPHLWNKLPFSLREPVSPLYAYLNPSFCSPLSPSITPSLFHSKLKTYLFGKSFPP